MISTCGIAVKCLEAKHANEGGRGHAPLPLGKFENVHVFRSFLLQSKSILTAMQVPYMEIVSPSTTAVCHIMIQLLLHQCPYTHSASGAHSVQCNCNVPRSKGVRL